MIIDYYKFKKEGESSTRYALISSVSQSGKHFPASIKIHFLKSNESNIQKAILNIDKDTSLNLIFPIKTIGLGKLENGSDLILVKRIVKLPILLIYVIRDQAMYTEILYQRLVSGWIHIDKSPKSIQ
jgi:hypothetical protein